MKESLAESYMPAFTSYQAEELAARGAMWSPITYEAIGDGIKDDTTACQAAIDQAELNGGGIVYFPPGIFRITSPLTVSSAKVRIVGSGIQVTKIKKDFNTANTEAILITASNCGVSHLTIEGITLAAFAVYEHGIRVQGTDDANRLSNVTINDVEVLNTGHHGIFAEYCKYFRAERCKLHNIGYLALGVWSCDYSSLNDNEIYTITPGSAGNTYGIAVSHITTGDTQCKYATISRNLIYDAPLWEGIDTHGGKYLTVSENTILGCKRGILMGIDVNNSYVPDYCNVINNTIDAQGITPYDSGIIYAGIDAGTKATGGIISGNIIKDHGYAASLDWGAITCYSTQNLSITNNQLIDSKSTAICLYQNNDDLVITGNSINGIVVVHANSSGVVVRNTNNTGLMAHNVIRAGDAYGIYSVVSNTSLEQGHNKISTTTSKLIQPEYMGRGTEIYGNLTFDPGNLVDGQGTIAGITVVGANLGDAVEFSAPYDLQGITVTGYVQVVNTVHLRLQNESGGAVDLGNGNWKVKVTKM